MTMSGTGMSTLVGDRIDEFRLSNGGNAGVFQ